MNHQIVYLLCVYNLNWNVLQVDSFEYLVLNNKLSSESNKSTSHCSRFKLAISCLVGDWSFDICANRSDPSGIREAQFVSAPSAFVT